MAKAEEQEEEEEVQQSDRSRSAPQSLLVGGIQVAHAPAFTTKGSRLFVPCSSVALCYSVKTTRLLGSLAPHKGHVTAVCCAQSKKTGASESVVVTGTDSGEVKIWDAKSLVLVGSVSFVDPILSLAWTMEETLFVLVGQRGGEAWLEQVQVSDTSAPRRLETAPLSVNQFGAFNAASDAAVLLDKRGFRVWRRGWRSSKFHGQSHEPTAVCVDPLLRYVAVGDVKGVIWTWWGVLDDDNVKSVPARWHWHSASVRTLLPCGPLCLSGGDEGALCMRNVEDDNLNVVPRFPGPLRHLAVCSAANRICVSVAENTLALIDELHGFIKPRWIHGVDVPIAGPDARVEAGQQDGDVLHSLSGTAGVAMTASGRRIQFLDNTGSCHHSQTLRLDRGNYVQPMDTDAGHKWTLLQIAFSFSANHIMTCESRRSPAVDRFHNEGGRTLALKWWRRGGDGHYELHSLSNSAHVADVTVALAHPNKEHCFVTGALDGTFKFWDLKTAKKLEGKAKQTHVEQKQEQRQCWQCTMLGNWRNRPVMCGCFAADGSILAFGFSGFVVLFETSTGRELHVFPLRETSDKVQSLLSIVACGRLLLVASVCSNNGDVRREELLVWDVMRLSVAAKLDLAKALPRRGPILVRVASDNHVGLRLLLARRTSKELQLWQLAPSDSMPDGALVFTQETRLTSVPVDQGISDVSFRESDKRLLCWTSRHELWDMDIAEAKSMMVDTPAMQVLLQEEEPEARRGKLARLVGGRETAADVTQPEDAVQLLRLPLRTTQAQQAGITPHLIEKIVPPHVPSHMLQPPSMIWAGLLSVFGKTLPTPTPSTGQAPAGKSRPSADAAAAALEAPGSAKTAEGEDTHLPPWLSAGSRPPAEADRSEFVDIDWMDQLVSDALGTGQPAEETVIVAKSD